MRDGALEKGLTLGQQGEYQQMTQTFADLLQKFPNSPGAAQANFWIGGQLRSQALSGGYRPVSCRPAKKIRASMATEQLFV